MTPLSSQSSSAARRRLPRRVDLGLDRSRAAVGLTIKSGWVAAVLLLDGGTAPRMVDCRIVELSDPADPRARQPYHATFGTPRKSGPDLTRLVASVRAYGRRSLTQLFREYRAQGHDLAGVGIVVGSLTDPARIANDHIRIHALEGQLFRGVAEDAAGRSELAYQIWRERDLPGCAVEILGQSESAVREQITSLGRGRDGPWRVEQKAAALAAWLVLCGR